MKNKFMFAVFVFILFSFGSVVSAATTPHKKSALKENISDLRARTKSLEEQVMLLQNQIDVAHPVLSENMMKMQKAASYDKDNKNRFDTLVEMYAHGPAVVTSPAFGVRRAAEDEFEDESPLMAQLSSINEDLVLLHLRKKMDTYAVKNGIEIPTRPIIALSGALEGMANYKYDYNRTDKVDVDLSSAELDIIGETGPWVTSAIIATYDNDRLTTTTGTRVSNSKLRIDRGFITIGQLNRCPLYFTIGQIFAPFGRYSSNMITTTPTSSLGQFKDRMVVLGYSSGLFNVQVYGFPGETKGVNNGSAKSFLGHSGINIGTDYAIGKFQFDVEASAMGNIAETDEMQKNVFAKTTTSESIRSRVWGIDGRIKAKYAPFTIMSEYVGAARRFDLRDLMFNDAGARPQALNVEGSIEFKTLDKPSEFAIGYNQTWQALALELPRNTFFVEYDIAFFKSTLFAIEYRHDINYRWNDKATGMLAGSVDGRHKNTVTAKIAVYF